jgi:hypothetical protein
MSTEKTETPTYLSQAGVARKLGIGRAAIANYRKRHPGEVPKPAAYMEQEGEPAPLWLPEQMQAWLAFQLQRSGPDVQAMIGSLDEQAQAMGYGSITEMLTATEMLTTTPGATVEAPQGDGSAK